LKLVEYGEIALKINYVLIRATPERTRPFLEFGNTANSKKEQLERAAFLKLTTRLSIFTLTNFDILT
jgi:hypothetical protein